MHAKMIETEFLSKLLKPTFIVRASGTLTVTDAERRLVGFKLLHCPYIFSV